MKTRRNITVVACNGQRVTYTPHDIDATAAMILQLANCQDESPSFYLDRYPTILRNAIKYAMYHNHEQE